MSIGGAAATSTQCTSRRRRPSRTSECRAGPEPHRQENVELGIIAGTGSRPWPPRAAARLPAAPSRSGPSRPRPSAGQALGFGEAAIDRPASHLSLRLKRIAPRSAGPSPAGPASSARRTGRRPQRRRAGPPRPPVPGPGRHRPVGAADRAPPPLRAGPVRPAGAARGGVVAGDSRPSQPSTFSPSWSATSAPTSSTSAPIRPAAGPARRPTSPRRRSKIRRVDLADDGAVSMAFDARDDLCTAPSTCPRRARHRRRAGGMLRHRRPHWTATMSLSIGALHITNSTSAPSRHRRRTGRNRRLDHRRRRHRRSQCRAARLQPGRPARARHRPPRRRQSVRRRADHRSACPRHRRRRRRHARAARRPPQHRPRSGAPPARHHRGRRRRDPGLATDLEIRPGPDRPGRGPPALANHGRCSRRSWRHRRRRRRGPRRRKPSSSRPSQPPYPSELHGRITAFRHETAAGVQLLGGGASASALISDLAGPGRVVEHRARSDWNVVGAM